MSEQEKKEEMDDDLDAGIRATVDQVVFGIHHVFGTLDGMCTPSLFLSPSRPWTVRGVFWFLHHALDSFVGYFVLCIMPLTRSWGILFASCPCTDRGALCS